VVEFELPTRAQVRIALYDMAGRRVRTVIEGVRDAGRGTAMFDGRGLPGGVYFLRMQIGGEATSQRIVVLR
jgi:hypothetical protein